MTLSKLFATEIRRHSPQDIQLLARYLKVDDANMADVEKLASYCASALSKHSNMANMHYIDNTILTETQRDLMNAIAANDIDEIKTLFQQGVDSDTKNEALRRAAQWNRPDIVDFLLDEGIDIHANNDTALRAAVFDNNIETARLLINRGADIHVNNDNFLINAAGDYRRFDMLKLLLEHGADPNAQNGFPLRKAARSDNVKAVQYLIHRGADVHMENDLALLWTVASQNHQNHETAKILLDHGANVNAQNGKALEIASKTDQLEMVHLLLKRGADVHAGDDIALRTAVAKDLPEMVRLLLDHGANKHANEGEALRVATEMNNRKIIRLLTRAETLIDDLKKLPLFRRLVNSKKDQINDPYKGGRLGMLEFINMLCRHVENDEDLQYLRKIAKQNEIENYDTLTPEELCAEFRRILSQDTFYYRRRRGDVDSKYSTRYRRPVAADSDADY